MVFVDDTIITGSDHEERVRLEKGLVSEFLGIEGAHSGQGILQSQQKYILNFLTEISFSDHQPTRTTIEVDHKLTLNKTEEKVDIGRYQRLIRKLIY